MAGYSDVIPVDTIVAAVRQALEKHGDIDVLTITANGEPTLYPHLLQLIEEINLIKGDTKTLILSNGSTIMKPEVQKALLLIDTVKLSLDCATAKCLKRIDRVHKNIDVLQIRNGMLEFGSKTINPLIIEILIVEGINNKPSEIKELNDFLLRLKPDRIDLGTIDRPPAYSVKPVSYDELRAISLLFDPALDIHITQRKNAESKPSSYSSDEIISTLHKRPLTQDDIDILFDKGSKKRLSALLLEQKIAERDNQGVLFFTILQ